MQGVEGHQGGHIQPTQGVPGGAGTYSVYTPWQGLVGGLEQVRNQQEGTMMTGTVGEERRGNQES